MRFSDCLHQMALLAAMPALVTSSPLPKEDGSISRLATHDKRRQPGVCGKVPLWVDDVPHWKKHYGSSPVADEGNGPGSARSCLEMAHELEVSGRYEWDSNNVIGSGNRELLSRGRCRFNIGRFQDNGWTIIVQGQDVADIIRDAVKMWCPNSWHMENGVMVGNADESGKCPLMGHGVVDDCMQRAHGNGRSSLLWTISSNVLDWSDDGEPRQGGSGWSGGPIR